MSSKIGWVLGLGLGAFLLYSQRQQISGAAQSGVEDVQAALAGWKSVNDGPLWVPVINGAEDQYGIPPDLLARMAYQESRFRSDVIDGTTASPAGALGILQMLPKYFATVAVPVPFSQSDTAAQIAQAAQQLVALYNHFQDWGLALAGYNDGQTNIDNYLNGQHTLPAETINYVSQILSDVPVTGATVPA